LSKILVTGGFGFIGLNLAEKLVKQGNEVFLCDNLFRGKDDESAKKVLELENTTFIKADLTDKNEFSKFDKYDQVYHLAAINGTKFFYEMPEKVLRTNILSCIHILDWFKDTKKGKILFSSSSETYAGTVSKFNAPVPTPEQVELCISDPYNARWSYGGSKITGELLFINYARIFKFPMSIIRYHNIYGPRMGFEHVIPEFIERASKKENPFNLFGGPNKRAFCYISDAVDATIKVMQSDKTDFETVNIGNSNEEISISDLAKKVFSLANYSPTIKENSSPDGSVTRRCPDTSKIEKLTGFIAKIGIDNGLKKTFDWYWEYYSKNKK